MAMFAGSPLYLTCTCGASAPASARARVVPRPRVPVCTDLLTIGPGTVIRKDALLHRLPRRRRADPDRPVTLGARRGRRREDGARHRHRAGRRRPARPLLRRCTPGSAVPAGQRWHGSPARPRTRRRLPGAGRPAAARAAPVRLRRCCSWSTLLVLRPARPRAAVELLRARPLLADAHRSRARTSGVGPDLYAAGRRLSLALFCRRVRSPGLVFVATVPRAVLNLSCGRTRSTRSTASATGCTGSSRARPTHASTTYLFGDSSSILHYLRLDRLPTSSAGGADRLELRRRGAARDAVPQRASAAGRWSPTGCR